MSSKPIIITGASSYITVEILHMISKLESENHIVRLLSPEEAKAEGIPLKDLGIVNLEKNEIPAETFKTQYVLKKSSKKEKYRKSSKKI